MTSIGEEITTAPNSGTATAAPAQQPLRQSPTATDVQQGGLRQLLSRVRYDKHLIQFVATFLTTLTIYGIFLIQGIIVARILGATGRGEFGTALYFPRDIFLYAGLLGAIEIVTGYAAKQRCDSVRLKYSAAKLGLITGSITAVIAVICSIALLVPTGKAYLLPWCLLVCLFVPFEHIHLTISSVDRGDGSIGRYNVNRLLFALVFPVLMLAAWLVGLDQITGLTWLTLTCGLFVIGRILGLLPTLRGMELLSSKKRKQIRAEASDKSFEVPSAPLLLREGRPYAVSMFVSELFERLDIFLILVLATVVDSGYYFVAVPAAAMLTIAPNALGVFTFNAGAREDVHVSRSTAIRMMCLTAAFQIVVTVIFALIIDDLIILFYTSEYQPAIVFALWLLPASAIKGFLQAADGYLKGAGKPMIGVWARAISIFIMLAFVAATYSKYQLISIPMAACVGQFASMLIIVAGVLKHVGEEESPSMDGGAA